MTQDSAKTDATRAEAKVRLTRKRPNEPALCQSRSGPRIQFDVLRDPMPMLHLGDRAVNLPLDSLAYPKAFVVA